MKTRNVLVLAAIAAGSVATALSSEDGRLYFWAVFGGVFAALAALLALQAYDKTPRPKP